ncbi:MAG: MFS transporter [Steroidobacteraceae bacterium]
MHTTELRERPGPVLASMAGIAFSVATLGFTYSIGPFVNPLVAEFGWSRQQILGAQPLVTLAVVATSALMGWIADRGNVRRWIIGSQLLFGLGFFALALWLDSLTRLYLLYFLLALAGGGTVGIGFARILAQRYERQRGLALGIAMAGTGLCGFLAPPYASWAIERYGWRGGYVALGLLPLCIALPLAWRYLHDGPRTQEVASAAASAAPATRAAGTSSGPAVPAAGTRFVDALRGYRFWFLAVGLFGCSGMMTAIVTSLVPLLQERGIATAPAALIAGGFGAAVLVGRIVVGALVDRYWAPLVGAALMFPAALAVLALAGTPAGPAASAAIVFMAGLAAGAEVDLMAYLTARYFGLREFGRIFAALYIGFALGPGVMVPLFGRARDATGGYETGLYVAAAGIALFGVLLLALGPYPASAAPQTGDAPRAA